MKPKLAEYLKKFKTIEDFRVVEPEINEMLQGVGNLSRGRNLNRLRSVSESDGTAVVAAGSRKPNTTISNRSDYVGNRPQYQQQLQQQQHQQQHNNQQSGSYANFSSNRRRTGSFGSGTVRVRSGSLGNKPQVVSRNNNYHHHYGSSPHELRRGGSSSGLAPHKQQNRQQQQQQKSRQQVQNKDSNNAPGATNAAGPSTLKVTKKEHPHQNYAAAAKPNKPVINSNNTAPKVTETAPEATLTSADK